MQKNFKKFNANFIIWSYFLLYLAIIALPSLSILERNTKNDLCGYFTTMSPFAVTNWSQPPQNSEIVDIVTGGFTCFMGLFFFETRLATIS